MTKVEKKINDLTEALKRAVLAAQELKDTEDGGTCNFDSPKLFLDGWSRKSIETACKAAGLVCFDHKLFLKDKVGWVICGGTSGQGNRRTRMAERMAESLTNDGYTCYMYYQAD